MKKSSLAEFSQKTSSTVPGQSRSAGKRQRGQGDSVAITVRLPKREWMRLQMFAMDQGTSLQSLAVSGFSKELAAKGQPPLDV